MMNAKELNEAITAGQQALGALQQVRQNLSSAGNWGIVDILGGGLITNLIKHDKISRAQANMEQARAALQNFQRELRDLDTVPTEIALDVDGFLTFADFFFDGFLADVFVQSKIDQARQQVDAAGEHVQAILNWLYAQHPQENENNEGNKTV